MEVAAVIPAFQFTQSRAEMRCKPDIAVNGAAMASPEFMKSLVDLASTKMRKAMEVLPVLSRPGKIRGSSKLN